MKHVKILALAAVAVAAFMATLGAGSAAATPTALCKVKETPLGMSKCPDLQRWPAGTPIHANLHTGTKLVFETPMGKVECATSTIQATLEQVTQIPLGAEITALTFANCGEYTVTTILKGTLDIEVIDIPFWTHNGTLTFTGTKIGIKKGATECEYFPGHGGTLTGGNPHATIDLVGTLTRFAGTPDCPPGNATWKGAYTVLKPTPLWVSE